jgi:uncharacterized cupredoxin-like copper-binding protein
VTRSVVAAAALSAVAAASLGSCGGGARAAAPETVHVTIRHSKFSPDHLRLRPGTTVRFVVHNTDPIEHELIVGDPAVQQEHEVGTDKLHEGPGAVSLPAGATRTTTYTVPHPTVGQPLLYGCHLPGHWAYGMRGTIALKPTT